jgi:hypothetical protein
MKGKGFSKFIIPQSIIVFSIVIQSIVFFLLLSMGLYYHSSINEEYALQNIVYLNSLNIAAWVGHAALFLQVYRFYQTGKIMDVMLAVGGVIFSIVLFVPSGSRGQAFQFIPLLALMFLTLENKYIVKCVAIGLMVVFGLLLTMGMGTYRDFVGQGILSEKEGIVPIIEATRIGMETLDKSKILIVHRLSDFVATGRIIDYSPDIIPFRGFGDIIDWWQMFLPGAIRPDFELAMDGARETVRYDVAYSTQFGSSPVMIVGDLYGRGGWSIVVIGMVGIGFILGVLDRQFLFQMSPFAVIFFVLYGRHILSVASSSLLNVFIIFTRELILMYVISYVLTEIVSYLGNENFRWRKIFD